jgi:predicted ATPase/DNA-binding SARP family transcriptional activator
MQQYGSEVRFVGGGGRAASGVIAVGVLGPVLLQDADGVPVPLGSGRQRRLLAALALQPGADVDRDLLVELVWGDEQPADPVAALHTCVARLRKVLPAPMSIMTGPRGYRLAAADGAVDSLRFGTHLDAAAAATDPARRLDELDAGLRLWRGRPFAELDHPAVGPEATRLADLQARAQEDRAEALLELGRAADAAAASAALVTAEPLRERAVAVLIRALVAAGRPAEALHAFARLRAELAEQLGTEPSAELRRLHEQVLREELAPAPSARRPTIPISSFVGREADLARVRAVLARHRVVTLCGPGGVGKTRLARHVAAAVADRYADGALTVELAATGPEAVTAVLAAALGVSEAGRGSLGARVVEVLAVRHQLLVLDDCEHVLDAVAPLVEAIALGAPRVDLLATSREALRVDGERLLPVAPLAAGPAVELLADRVRALDPDAVTAADATVLERICARLDGLPLALELAAARVPALGLAGLLDALDDPLAALGPGRRTADPRHRSLRDVVEWSYGLLDDRARELFVRLGVFAGPVEPAAVAAVCGDARALPDLVDRSLVLRQGSEPVTYGMLDTLRAVGRARLATDPGATALRARHAAWAVELATDTAAARARPDEAAAVRRFDAHRTDIERAHAWLCEHGPLEDLLRLGLVCAELGYQRVRADLVRLVEEALIAAGCDPDAPEPATGAAAGGITVHPLLPRLLGLSAVPLWQRGDLDGARRRALGALALAERAGEPAAGRDGWEVLSNVAMFAGDLDGALAHGDRAIALSRATGDRTTELIALVDCTLAAAYAGDQSRSAGYESAAVRLAERLGSPLARGWAAYGAGERRAEAGDPASAGLLAEAVVLAEQVDAVFLAGVARHTLLTTAARADDPERALSRFGPLLDTWHAMGAWTQLWIAVRALAEALSRRGRHADAAVLLGALRSSGRGGAESGADFARVRAIEAAARDALGPRFAQLQAEGVALGDSGAVALARRLVRTG